MFNSQIIDKHVERTKKRLEKRYPDFSYGHLVGSLEADMVSILIELQVNYPEAYQVCIRKLVA